MWSGFVWENSAHTEGWEGVQPQYTCRTSHWRAKRATEQRAFLDEPETLTVLTLVHKHSSWDLGIRCASNYVLEDM